MNVLMAWELGAGLAHAVVLHLTGQELTSRGHAVSYALRNTETAKTLHFDENTAVYQAPVMGVVRPDQSAAYDYADLLLVRAYEDLKRLQSRIDGWMAIYEQTKPDLVVTDHAPCARLACHIAGITSHMVGNGFAVPPWSKPLHPFQHEPGRHPARQQTYENRLDRAINKVLALNHKPPVARAIDIFLGGHRSITMFEELDNYGGRPDDSFCGPVMQLPGGAVPHWPADSTIRVFIYLYADAPVLPAVLNVLNDMGASSLVYAGGTVSDQTVKTAGPLAQFSEVPVDLAHLKSAGCNLVVCQGGASTVVSALLQGIPVMTYPRHVEQGMLCKRLEQANLSRTIRREESGEITARTIRETVLSLLEGKPVRAAAQAFAKKYQAHEINQGTKFIADEIEQNHRVKSV